MSSERRSKPSNFTPRSPERLRDTGDPMPDIRENSTLGEGDSDTDENAGELRDVFREDERRSSSAEPDTLRDAVAERPRSRLADRADEEKVRDIKTALDECE